MSKLSKGENKNWKIQENIKKEETDHETIVRLKSEVELKDQAIIEKDDLIDIQNHRILELNKSKHALEIDNKFTKIQNRELAKQVTKLGGVVVAKKDI